MTTWNKGKTFLLVTGASRGLGRAFSQELSAGLSPGSTVYLTARCKAGLDETAVELKSDLDVKTFEVDHQRAGVQAYRDMMLGLATDFESAIIVHNAGSIGVSGGLSTVRKCDDKEDIDGYLALNYTSPVLINSAFMTRFADLKRVTVVNISSLCALEPWQTYGHYCAIKAARDMLFSVLAKEEDNVRVLSYSPGPVDTQLVQSVLTDTNLHASIRDGYRKMIEDNTILSPKQSAQKLVEILNADTFKSGQHFDYYDEL